MPKYTAWIPTWASVKYELETEEELSDDDLKERFEAEAQECGGLCHYCANGVEIGDANWQEWDGHIDNEEGE